MRTAVYYILLPIIANLAVKLVVWTLLVPSERPVVYCTPFRLVQQVIDLSPDIH